MSVRMPRPRGLRHPARGRRLAWTTAGSLGLALCLLGPVGAGLPATSVARLVTAAPAWGAEDGQQTGTLTVRLEAGEDGAAVAGGELSLYQLAQASGDSGGAAVALPAFSELQELLAKPASPEVASRAAELARQATPWATVAVGEDGSCVFTGLSQGVYLVTQPQAAPGYYALAPFVVTVPQEAGTGAGAAYDVCATPKVEPLPADDGKSSTPDKGTSEDRLIQTGQLKWPVPVLAGAGVALFAAGWAHDRSRGSRER